MQGCLTGLTPPLGERLDSYNGCSDLDLAGASSFGNDRMTFTQLANRTRLQAPLAFALLAALTVAPNSASGQIFGNRAPVQPHCDDSPRPYASGCRCATPCQGVCARPCAETPPAKPRDAEVPRPAPAPQATLRETGYYQAGPRTGALEGASSTLGFRGGAITLPRLRLELPSLELPSFFRSSHTAKMRIAESEAPWTSTGYERVAWASEEPQQRAAEPPPQEPRARAAEDDACEELKARYEQKIAELDKQILACEQLRKDLERTLSAPRTPAPPPVPGHAAPHCPPAPAPLPHPPTPHAVLPSSPVPKFNPQFSGQWKPQELPAPSPEPAEASQLPATTTTPPAATADEAAARFNPQMIPAGDRQATASNGRMPLRLPSL